MALRRHLCLRIFCPQRYTVFTELIIIYRSFLVFQTLLLKNNILKLQAASYNMARSYKCTIAAFAVLALVCLAELSVVSAGSRDNACHDAVKCYDEECRDDGYKSQKDSGFDKCFMRCIKKVDYSPFEKMLDACQKAFEKSKDENECFSMAVRKSICADDF